MFQPLNAHAQLEYTVDVQIVDLQVTVVNERGEFIRDVALGDIVVTEDGKPQEVLELDLQREPFSIAVLLDTSSSMQSLFMKIGRATRDFLSSLSPEDEYLLMTFDDRIRMVKDFEQAGTSAGRELPDLHFGDRTRLYDALKEACTQLQRSRYPRRALFLISDGENTLGGGTLSEAIRAAQSAKILVYALIVQKGGSDGFTMQKLVDATGGTSFVLYDEFPRLQAAYEKIATDLANRWTLVYRSTSDYSRAQKPEIRILMKNPRWKARYQKAYYN